MARIAGKYVSEKSENLEPFLNIIGVSSENKEKILKPKTIVEWSVEGNTYKCVSVDLVTVTFVLNEEFDDPILRGVKCIATLNGDVLTVTAKLTDGRVLVRSHHFTDNGFTMNAHVDGASAKYSYTRI